MANISKTNLILLFILSFLIISCGNSNKTESADEKLVLTKETIPLQKITIDKGKLEMHSDGYSIGKNTELTELQNQLKNDTCDIIEITWIWTSKYPDMPMKIIYNKYENNLKMTFMQNGVIEEYKNVSPECLSEFLNNGEKSFYSLEKYCENSKYSFDRGSSIKPEAGEKPKQNEVTGSVEIVKDFIKNIAHDVSKVKFIEWTEVSPAGEFWVVRCKYKGSNAFGATVTENAWFYIQNNQVIKMRNID